MTSQPDLFTYEQPAAAKAYPDVPGFRGEKGGTSQKAAEAIAPVAGSLRDRALELIRRRPMTADEVAKALRLDKGSIRPRLSELHELGLATKTEARRRNASGKLATVYAAAVMENTNAAH